MTYYRLTANPYPNGFDDESEPAALTYHPDMLQNGFVRLWIDGERFQEEPPLPIVAIIAPNEQGHLLELYQMPLCVISRRLVDFFIRIGVNNIDYYSLEIHDEATGIKRNDYNAFNIVGCCSMEEIRNSDEQIMNNVAKPSCPMIVRCRESLSQVYVHHYVVECATKEGLTTILEFLPL